MKNDIEQQLTKTAEEIKNDMVWEIEGNMQDCFSHNKWTRRDKIFELFELSKTSEMAAEAVSEAMVEKFGVSLEWITYLEDFDVIIKEMREIGLIITDEMLRAMKERAITLCNFDSVHIKGNVKQGDKIRRHFAEKYKL